MWNKQQYQSATLPLIVLRLLQEGDKSGLQLVNEMKSGTGDNYEVCLGALLPVLYPLEQAGYISKQQTADGMHCYHLMPSGYSYWYESQKEYKEMEQSLRKIMDKN